VVGDLLVVEAGAQGLSEVFAVHELVVGNGGRLVPTHS
jgi:hypothetical protein